MTETTTISIGDQVATITGERKPNGDVRWTVVIDAEPLDVWNAELLIRHDDTVCETAWQVQNGGWETAVPAWDGFTTELKLINPSNGPNYRG